MNNAMKTHGAFSWSELITSDVEAAKSFYSDVLGWTTEDMVMPEMTYTVVKASDGSQVGGMMATPKETAGTPPHWGTYVTVDDVDARAKKVTAAGGKIVMPAFDIPNTGRMCLIQDPQGAMLSLITYFES